MSLQNIVNNDMCTCVLKFQNTTLSLSWDKVEPIILIMFRLFAGVLGDLARVVDLPHPGQQQRAAPAGDDDDNDDVNDDDDDNNDDNAGEPQPPGQHLVVVAAGLGRGWGGRGPAAQALQPPRTRQRPEGRHQQVGI